MASILIADDDPIVRQFAVELLRTSDHALVQAANGREAVNLLQAVPIDLLVVDMLMPEMDGLETIMSVRRSHPNIRILAISSGGRVGVTHLLQLAETFGADAVLAKPLQLHDFAGVINALLSRELGHVGGSEPPALRA